MNFDELLVHIKKDGCRVRIWHNKEYIGGAGGNFSVTSFGPLINVAAKGDTIEKIATTLLHEYGHFLQWRDGFLPCIDEVCDTYGLYYEWLDGTIDLSPLEWKIARNTMLWIEWDAEVRGYTQARRLNIDGFNPDFYIKGAMGYIISIKWSWDSRLILNKSIQNEYVGDAKIYTTDELFAPLTDAEKSLIKYINPEAI